MTVQPTILFYITLFLHNIINILTTSWDSSTNMTSLYTRILLGKTIPIFSFLRAWQKGCTGTNEFVKKAIVSENNLLQNF